METALIWLRRDLRLRDHACFAAALKAGQKIICLYIYEEEGPRPLGSASRWWQAKSLLSFKKSLEARGGRVILAKGKALEIVPDFCARNKIGQVYWSRRYEQGAIAVDTALKTTLKNQGIEAKSFNNSLFYEPWEITNKEGNFYKVYTAFWKACMAKGPLPEPISYRLEDLQFEQRPLKAPLGACELEPYQPFWTGGFAAEWQVGEEFALKKAKSFCQDLVVQYKADRDFPAKPATSQLSPHLVWGEISPRQIHALLMAERGLNLGSGEEQFLKEIFWREFAYHLLFNHPDMASMPMDKRFLNFPWQKNEPFLKAWQKGQTGYPIVDAGMRQLWQTGWMHNRVRMIVGSFLIKDLGLSWQEGEAWFWDCLVDADPANNPMGWQWVAGCGADAAPFYRVFNPTLQGQKFDPTEEYVKHYIPELGSSDYPKPLIDHAKAREAALLAFQEIKKS